MIFSVMSDGRYVALCSVDFLLCYLDVIVKHFWYDRLIGGKVMDKEVLFCSMM